jgi:hypothetical protein
VQWAGKGKRKNWDELMEAEHWFGRGVRYDDDKRRCEMLQI